MDSISQGAPTARLLYIISTGTWADDYPRLMAARAATVHNDVVVHRSTLSPLGQVVLAEIAGTLSPSLSTAQVLAVLQLLEQRIVCVARLRSVAGLADPPPTVFQHALSWWPTSRFIAMTGHRVWTGIRAYSDPRFATADPGSVLAITPQTADADAEFVTQLTRLWQPTTTIVRDADTATFWGSSPISQACHAPGDIRPFVSAVVDASHLCSWCQEPFAGSTCPICSGASAMGDSQ